MPKKRCVIKANERKGLGRPNCAIGVELPCKSIKCRQSQGKGQLTKMMINQGINVGRKEMGVISQVAEHYFCSTALGKRPRDFGYFKVRELRPGSFEIRFKNARYTISFA